MARKKKKRVKFKVKNIIILFIICSFIGLMIYCVGMMPIDNIYINGNEIITDEEIMEMVDIDEYPSFVLANRFEMKKILLNNDYISDVVIKKKIGNVLEFEIHEYKVVANDINNRILLSSGKVLDNIYGICDLPLLLNDISDSDVYKLFVNKMTKLDRSIFRQISEIEYSPVPVDKERFIFYMNDGNLVHVTLTKLEKMNKYDKIKDKMLNKKGIIYLDSGDYIEVLN